MPLVCYRAHAPAIAACLQLWQEKLGLPKPFQRFNHLPPAVSQTMVFYWPKTRGCPRLPEPRLSPKIGALIRM